MTTILLTGSDPTGAVSVLYSVTAPTTTTVPAETKTGTVPVATTPHPLAFTGAPILMEVGASFALLLAGALAAISARRKVRHLEAPSR